MSENIGRVVSVNGNLLSVAFDGNVSMNEICYVKVGETALKSEVIRIRGNVAQIQVYEMTGGIECGDDLPALCPADTMRNGKLFALLRFEIVFSVCVARENHPSVSCAATSPQGEALFRGGGV